MTSEKKEIRSILLGRTIMGDNGKLTSLPKGEFHLPLGVADGAAAIRFLGVARHARRYKSSLNEKDTLAAAEAAMREIGRGLSLQEQPEAAACLIRYMLTRPVVLTFRYMDGIPVLAGWSGRGIMGWISIRRALGAFARHVPEELSRSAGEVPKEKKESRREKKKQGRRTEASEDTIAENTPASASVQDDSRPQEEQE